MLNNCDLFEMEVTAPDGTTITSGDPRYDKQDDYRLIVINAAGFEVNCSMLLLKTSLLDLYLTKL